MGSISASTAENLRAEANCSFAWWSRPSPSNPRPTTSSSRKPRDRRKGEATSCRVNLSQAHTQLAEFNTGRHVGIETQRKMFAPRFGFAYQLAGRTVLRGGYGLFYNANGSGGGLYRMHRYLPFAASDAVTVNEFAPNYPKAQGGLPPAPSTDFATVSNNPVGSFLTVPANYHNSYAE